MAKVLFDENRFLAALGAQRSPKAARGGIAPTASSFVGLRSSEAVSSQRSALSFDLIAPMNAQCPMPNF
ncbi:MAG: hypothetical protein F6J93_03365 [Oscillatoria sp. SIO1A7]|nr:hypothetical protein [Oscillatoria sp. SIO1A7]